MLSECEIPSDSGRGAHFFNALAKSLDENAKRDSAGRGVCSGRGLPAKSPIPIHLFTAPLHNRLLFAYQSAHHHFIPDCRWHEVGPGRHGAGDSLPVYAENHLREYRSFQPLAYLIGPRGAEEHFPSIERMKVRLRRLFGG